MNLIMTGATSFIGLALTKEFIKEGCHVFALVRKESAGKKRLSEIPGVTVIEKSLAEVSELPEEKETLFKEKKPELWVHLGWDGVGSAGRQNKEIQMENIRNGLTSVKAAGALGIRRFLFTGSQAEYGLCREIMTEEHSCSPVSEYGKAKLEFGQQAGALCKSLGMEYIHTRIFSIYGPGDHPWSLVNSCVDTFLQGGEMKLGECTQKWNFLYIDDCARAVVRLALCEGGQELGGVYNVAGEDTRVLREFIEEIYEICQKRGSYQYGDRPPNAEGPASLIPDIAKIKAVTGWQPETSFASGIRRIIDSKGEF